ncbi:competence protein ComFB [Alicyclobacillus sacchari]|uniref:Competence protein ComFB n=1 Tax=Alicyclobacillus sacchari TaxID=392010 RepID=A0A4R8LPF2_9BACL|nr:late competence development ComFB family protein [Alicyclobacillus sacchari]TDY46303.1 competence protein ComFB [Alicyclobacillus sacchari]
MPIVNVTEQLAMQILQDSEIYDLLKCKCEQCISDVLAMTLNRLPARYVTTDAGRVFVNVNYYLQPQLQSDIVTELTRSALQVANHPHHAQTSKAADTQ